MTVALQANDVQALSGGRFISGSVADQAAHHAALLDAVSHPARGCGNSFSRSGPIWDTWGTGRRAHFEGEFYSHTLNGPVLQPGPNPHGNPKIMLAAWVR